MILTNDLLTLEVSPHGAEPVSLQKGATALLWNADPQYWNRHAPILFPAVGKPFGNMLHIDGNDYPMKQHGFARDCQFDEVPLSPTSGRFVLSAQSMPAADRYPYHFRLEALYQLEGNTVEVTWSVENFGQRVMHFQIGAHPGFMLPRYDAADDVHGYVCFYGPDGAPVAPIQTSALDEGCRIPLPAPDAVPSQLPLGADTFAHDALIFEQRQVTAADLLDKDGFPVLRVSCSQADAFGIWAPHKPGCPFVCLEPWCGICDPKGFTGDIANRTYNHPLAPGDRYLFRYSITVM